MPSVMLRTGKSFDIAVFLHDVPEKKKNSWVKTPKVSKKKEGAIIKMHSPSFQLDLTTRNTERPISPFPRKLLSLFIKLENLF